MVILVSDFAYTNFIIINFPKTVTQRLDTLATHPHRTTAKKKIRLFVDFFRGFVLTEISFKISIIVSAIPRVKSSTSRRCFSPIPSAPYSSAPFSTRCLYAVLNCVPTDCKLDRPDAIQPPRDNWSTARYQSVTAVLTDPLASGSTCSCARTQIFKRRTGLSDENVGNFFFLCYIL